MAAFAVRSVEVKPMSRLFKALGDETRLRIVALLSHGELCVCHLEAALDLPQSSTSRQLATLRNAGVVDARREGTWVYYRLAQQADEDCRKQLRAVASSFSRREVLRHDVARLLQVKGPGSCK
jgi:ArsR family transcriptional regulator